MCSSPVHAADDAVTAEVEVAGQGASDWRLDRDKDGIRIYTRAVAGSRFRAVRAVMLTDYPMAQLVALIRDTEACPEWANLCKASRIVESVSETELYVYTHNDLPWPVTDRDAVAHVLWTVDDAGAAVRMTATATDGYVPAVKGITRLRDAVTGWIFRPQADGRIEVETHAHVDPGGPMPAWIINRLLLDAPHKTLLGMRRVLDSGRYREAEFGFLP
ncbi:MAG: START domain-containing protein [Pseudomonadota bacterium]